MSNVDLVYSKFEMLEEEVAHCYFVLQERFITSPRLARFWADAALEEIEHASILRYCREHGLVRSFEEVNEAMACRVDELLETVKSTVGNPDVNVDEAFFAALLMESSELDNAYERLTRPLETTHPLLYQAIRANLRSHHDAFVEGAAEFTKDRAYTEAFRQLGRGL